MRPYGWQDLELGHGLHETKQGLRYTICETARREVLDRLLRLNHERYAEEVAQGLHEKEAKGKTAKKGKTSNGKGGGNKESTLFLIRWHPLLCERCKVMEKTSLATP